MNLLDRLGSVKSRHAARFKHPSIVAEDRAHCPASVSHARTRVARNLHSPASIEANRRPRMEARTHG